MGEVKTAEDRYQNKLQFSSLNTAAAQNITTAVVFNATYDQHVRITPTAGDAWFEKSGATFTPTVSSGAFLPYGAIESIIVRAGEYIGSTAEINVVPYGEL